VDRARLLILAALLCFSSAISAGCAGTSVGPLAGRVVDAKTGQSVSGAEIFRTYGATDALAVIGEPGGNTFTPDWVTTGSDGGFSFPRRWLWLGGFYVLDPPSLHWIHPEYGWGFLSMRKVENHQQALIRLERNEDQLRHLKDLHVDPGASSYPCTSFGYRGAGARCRLVAYGDERRGR
jgi:hypothetical protein